MYSSVVERCPDKTEVLGPIPSTRTIMKNLYVVATPIGNIKDITYRAKEVLEKSTLILAEDTRVTKKLFNLLSISLIGKTFLSIHAQSSDSSIKKGLDFCLEHDEISLVSDAGTPAISDPGSDFVQAFRYRYDDSCIYPIPGVSAVIAALSVSGFPVNHFEFIGFIPHKKGRKTLFENLSKTEHSVVFYESPHRILKTLDSLISFLPERYIMVGREMTKSFEEYKIGFPKDILNYYEENKDKIKGEFCVVISPIYYKLS